jgi:hypothetical protein
MSATMNGEVLHQRPNGYRSSAGRSSLAAEQKELPVAVSATEWSLRASTTGP